MCIIAYKPAGEKFPSTKKLRAMFVNNPDGAGFMYADGDAVVIKKGFMEFSEFKRAFNEISARRDLAVVFHFRIATHGGINKAMTQPFPLSSKIKRLKSLDTRADVGVAHNGIITMTCDAREISDTALFIKKYLPRLTDDGKKFDAVALDLIDECINSRMVILEKSGDAHVIGRGWKCDGGVWYSNDSYITRRAASYKPSKTATPYSYSYGDDYSNYGVYGDICGGDCGVCSFRKWCYSTYDDAVTTGGGFDEFV